ncbi:alpha/beta hydrolase [Rhodococcus triatomae]|uniref:Alpha/beta hydrolase fold n=1 Tax=Rhodococcus triatomae TaxID=300028 RepID=A0A1G8KN71_9NOCA|nr:alpha/beta fold hydrolase [Rhodococcus triatomae]QNG18976.1 alpha/beta hydrolase [Rhodococcus triatomae]QNG25111.1 alpha/beta hydrolase [Rhodococcus triatomae]SDI44884.1 alpha/beta hydrolase fold [Rhodococcus triatomae]
MRRPVLLAIVLAVCCACGAGPSVRPHVAVEREPGPVAPEESVDDPAVDTPAPLGVPEQDLAWGPCDAQLPAPQGVTLECAQYEAQIDPGGALPGSFTMGALRARAANTPEDAAPLVFTSGSDRPSTELIGELAAGGLGPLLAAHPIVAVDRRGTGSSTEIDCLPVQDRHDLADLGQFTIGSNDRVERLSAISIEATVACTDYLQPQELTFDTAHAADDIEALRLLWGVDTLGLIGSGNGASVALAFAAKYPSNIGRLVLDSPEAVAVDAGTAAEHRVRGAEAALDAFAAQCVALACSLGPDPRAALTDLVVRAREGRIPATSSNAVLTALTGTLAGGAGDRAARVRGLADAASAALAGDPTPIGALANAAGADGDGRFVARCTDAQQLPSGDRVREFQAEWAERYPVFGPEAALELVSCTAWPATPPPAMPAELDVPVLFLVGTGDPVAGGEGLPAVTGAVGNAGAPHSTMTWHGSGHPAIQSECAQRAVVTYAADGTLPPGGSACPA